MSAGNAPTIRLPKSWKPSVRSAMLHVVSLAQYATVYTRSWAADSTNQRVRLKAEKDRAEEEVALFREELRIKDSRMTRIKAHRRPRYAPTERMAILELKAARGWSQQQVARTFHLSDGTIASWMKRVDEQGSDALLQLSEPVNKFPEFVRYVVQRLKTLCPTMGKKKISETLARAGLHLGTTTVGRILKEQPAAAPKPVEEVEESKLATRVVTSKYPNHVWNVDLTTVSTGAGYWCSWLPFALQQCWPFCWWVAIVMDHFSRRVMGVTVFRKEPTSEAMRAFLGRTISSEEAKPKHLISDKGVQFWCDGFQSWCRRHEIEPRFGAVGNHGSIAVIERLILTVKQTLGQLPLIPLSRERFRKELLLIREWYNEHRPHMTLGGKTPHEVYDKHFPANRKPRIEPRRRWPRGSPCAKPQTLVAGKPGQSLEMHVGFHGNRRHLPLVALQRAA